MLIIFVLLIALVSFSSNTEEDPVPTNTQPIQISNDTQAIESSTDTTTAPTVTESFVPDNGWHIENGEQYYYYDGMMYVDLQKIDGDYYYFYDDGALAVNTDVNYVAEPA